MLKLKKVAKLLNRNNLKHSLCCNYYVTNAETTKTQPLSSRQLAWNKAKEKYVNHPNVFYSSHLEIENEQNNFHPRQFGSKFDTQRAKHILESFENNIVSNQSYPKDWMNDYEFYEGSADHHEQENVTSVNGTADPTIPPSKVPCNGCGAHLHCASESIPGYIPKEIFKNRTVVELQTIICQRCHFLKNYNIALDVEVTPESYVQTISSIKDKFALAIVIVDLLDFPCSIWPGLEKILGSKRPVFVVGNKVDLLPRDSNSYLEHVKKCLRQQVLQKGLDNLNIKYLSLISAKTGYGIEELITQLHKIWKHQGDVFLMGCTNVGKSSLFNILLNSDYCRPEATDLVRKATACPWPGTTLKMLKFPILRPSDIRVHMRFKRLFSERTQKAAVEKLRKDEAIKTGSIEAAMPIGKVGRTFSSNNKEVQDAFAFSLGTKPIITLNEKGKVYKEARWCYDTPGVMHPDQITSLLTTEELLRVQPTEMITPRAVRMKPGMSIFLAGLARLDYLNSSNQVRDEWIKIFVFSSLKLPILIAATEKAEEIYKKYLGTEFLGIPQQGDDDKRLSRWPGLQKMKKDPLKIIGSINEENALSCDIILSSAGWIGIKIPDGQECTFQGWTPNGMGIHVRTPPLIPFAERIVGKHIRNSLAYHFRKPFVFRK